jgi:hypothetical protein
LAGHHKLKINIYNLKCNFYMQTSIWMNNSSSDNIQLLPLLLINDYFFQIVTSRRDASRSLSNWLIPRVVSHPLHVLAHSCINLFMELNHNTFFMRQFQHKFIPYTRIWWLAALVAKWHDAKLNPMRIDFHHQRTTLQKHIHTHDFKLK